jgi:uncharacterized protein with ATP-grasp and redox domains
LKTALECVPCLVRQSIDASRAVSEDPAVHQQVLREMLLWIAAADPELSPPAMGQRLHRRLREVTGVEDPYRAEKDRHNEMVLRLVPEMRARLEASDDPFGLAVKLAIAGNIIDLGVSGHVADDALHLAIDQALAEPIHGLVDDLRRDIAAAGDILYLADNCGEIVFDRLLIEQLPTDRVTVAVRGKPILNDATMVDAETVGLTDIVPVIDSGTDAPGTLLDDCSPDFRQRFAAADLIISKGQGNFESLSDVDAPIYFLFKVKCAVVAGHVGEPEGTHMVVRSAAWPGTAARTEPAVARE